MENIVGKPITQEIKNDLVCSWNEVEEARTSLVEVVEDTPEGVWMDVYNKNAMAAVRFTMLSIPHMGEARPGD